MAEPVITAISLRRRPDRWSACEAHLTSVLGGRPFDVFEGTDAGLAAKGADADARLSALEQAVDATVYRGWPITEVEDVRRCWLGQLDGHSDTDAWIAYERACARSWTADRARLYVDFFHRHVTLGDVGAALSHLRVAERAHAAGVGLQVVFEDDARPTAGALPALLAEVEALREAAIEWDLIYLHSARYSRGTEPAVHPTSRLRYASHRKVCHAYALSSSGAAKLAGCGFRHSIFSVDDFLPALHAGHPRPDIMALPCVRAVLDGGGFVALTFEDDAGLIEMPHARSGGGADSDSKAGSGSSVLLGDAGVQMLPGGRDADDAAPVAEGGASPGPAPDGAVVPAAAFALPPAVLLGELMDGGADDAAQRSAREAVAEQLATHGFARLRVSPDDLMALLQAERSTMRFFASPRHRKKEHAGRGGRQGELMLWSCGYSEWPHREQYHIVLGAPDAQPWPEAEVEAAEEEEDEDDETPAARRERRRREKAAAEAAVPMRTYMLDTARLLRGAALAVLSSIPEARTAVDACEATPSGCDPSVLDAFLYAAGEPAGGAPCGEATGGMCAHTDPGVLTLTRCSATPALEVLDRQSGRWVALEALGSLDDVLVLACEQLEAATAGKLAATMHRVAPPAQARATHEAVLAARGVEDALPHEARSSLVYELRLPEAWSGP